MIPRMASPKDPCERGRGLFGETRWTLIQDVRAGSELERMAALETLCKSYRLPLYCFARKWGLDPDDASDVVQEFLAEVIRRETFAKADHAKGRLRTFLLLSLRQQIADWQRRERAQKRGGGRRVLSLEQDAEEFYGSEPMNDQSPDKFFARKWAKVLCDRVLGNIRGKWSRRGHAAQFDALSPFLIERLEGAETGRLAATLGVSTANVRVKLHRLRKEFATGARKCVSETVMDATEVDDELRELGLSF